MIIAFETAMFWAFFAFASGFVMGVCLDKAEQARRK